jgi:hypothetical protein
MTEFNWEKNEAVVLQQQHRTAIHFNTRGDIVIRQEADWPHEESDPFLVIGAQNLRRVIARLTEMADEIDQGGPEEGEQTRTKDPTAADRQRRRRERKKGADNVVILPQAAE